MATAWPSDSGRRTQSLWVVKILRRLTAPPNPFGGYFFTENHDIFTHMLTDTEIEHIAKLARIELSDEMRSRMKHDLSEVLDYIALLEKADTAGVEPLYQVTGLQNQTRADERRGDLPVGRQVLVPDEKLTEYLVGQAPHSQGRLIKVKSVKSKA